MSLHPPAIPAGRPTTSARFIISLDFELYWGVRDKVPLANYRENLLGVRRSIPLTLELFREFEIHATWATVGMLFFETKAQLLGAFPALKPEYLERTLCPYANLNVGRDEREDPYHFAPTLIENILATPHQELGTHTFSHFYCLEHGQNVASFAADLDAAAEAAKRYDVELRSLVFPRNQFNVDYLSVCRERGILAYRGNPASWLYRPGLSADESLSRRIVRLADNYCNLAGQNGHERYPHSRRLPQNVPASRFLRPYSPGLKFVEPIRLRRILQEMTFAARHGLDYHLWWHPHNHGTHTAENLDFLRQILRHYAQLQAEEGMQTCTMGEVAVPPAVETPLPISVGA